MSRELVRNYYGSFGEREWERLTRPEGALEFTVTTHALTRFLPPSGHVLDIGGGPGRYALWLAQQGYKSRWPISRQNSLQLRNSDCK